MSYFPPPPPPPPRAQNYAVPDYPLHQNSFRGRGSRDNRIRGSHANPGDFGRPRSAYRPVSNARGNDEYPSHDGDFQRLQSHVDPHGTQQNFQKVDYKQAYNFNSQNKLPPPSQYALHNNLRIHNSRSQKRGHREAFGRGGQPHNLPKGQASPPVPSFGGPLPFAAMPPPPQGPKILRRKDQRKRNQLGLTPNTEGYESSEKVEEDDQDEEARFASAACSLTGQVSVLQVSYKGHTSTLQSSSDIAIWIAERKRRFPTKERVAEAAAQKKQREQVQREANVAHKQQQKKQIANAKGKKRKSGIEDTHWGTPIQVQEAQKDDDAREGLEEGQEASAKRRCKVEGFRRRLEKDSRSKEWTRSVPAFYFVALLLFSHLTIFGGELGIFWALYFSSAQTCYLLEFHRWSSDALFQIGHKVRSILKSSRCCRMRQGLVITPHLLQDLPLQRPWRRHC